VYFTTNSVVVDYCIAISAAPLFISYNNNIYLIYTEEFSVALDTDNFTAHLILLILQFVICPYRFCFDGFDWRAFSSFKYWVY